MRPTHVVRKMLRPLARVLHLARVVFVHQTFRLQGEAPTFPAVAGYSIQIGGVFPFQMPVLLVVRQDIVALQVNPRLEV
jgi:hypothetical protein